MAHEIRPAWAIDSSRPVETPAVVAQRYAQGTQRSVPTLELTAPTDGAVADEREVTVRVMINGQKVYVGLGGQVFAAHAANWSFRTFSAACTRRQPDYGSRQVADGGTSMRQVTAVAFGTRVGGFTDPAGDDNGPGKEYRYRPTACLTGCLRPDGSRRLHRRRRCPVVARIAGEGRNPVRGDKISLQRFNVYLPRHRQFRAGASWYQHEHRIALARGDRGDGRFNTAGAYRTAGLKTASATRSLFRRLTDRRRGPRSALGGLDLSMARYGVATLHSVAGEGIGFVRPVYSFGVWKNPPSGLEFGQKFPLWRWRGRARLRAESKDTDTRDPNALDVIVGPGQSQSSVLDWQTASPVQLPMLELAL